MKIIKSILFFSLVCLLSANYTYKDLPIQQSGRIKPFDSYARNHLLQFYGKKQVKEIDIDANSNKIEAVDWLFEILTNPEKELDRKIFNIINVNMIHLFINCMSIPFQIVLI